MYDEERGCLRYWGVIADESEDLISMQNAELYSFRFEPDGWRNEGEPWQSKRQIHQHLAADCRSSSTL